MSQIGHRNLENLSKKFRVPCVALFDGHPASPPTIAQFPKFNDQGPKIVVVYTYERAQRFAQNVSTQIGTHESEYVWMPPSKGNQASVAYAPDNEHVKRTSGEVFSRLQFQIHCGLQTSGNSDANRNKPFDLREMENMSLYGLLVLEGSIIDLYFQVTGFLIADYAKACFQNKEKLEDLCFRLKNRKTSKWYPDESRQHRFTSFDNPNGAFTNYRVTL